MSLSALSSLNKPPLVLVTGVIIAAGAPLIPVGARSLGMLQAANVISFIVNVASVSVPGRLDGAQQDAQVKQGILNPSSAESSPLTATRSSNDDRSRRLRSFVQPSGWAFSIWGLVYIGEAAFCVAQFVDTTQVPALLPQVTVPFVAANLIQSLWCASFRPSYNAGWHKYVSASMLAGTALSLSQMPADAVLSSWYLFPLVIHFGWTTAATLVNLNSSVAAEEKVPETLLVGLGHGSAVVATGLGVSLTSMALVTPAYGFTIAWALLAVASNRTLSPESQRSTSVLKTGAKVQRILCYAGSALCAAASVYSLVSSM